MENDTFSVDDVYLQLKGNLQKREFGIIEVYSTYNKRIKELVDLKLNESNDHLLGFVNRKFKVQEGKINALNPILLRIEK